MSKTSVRSRRAGAVLGVASLAALAFTGVATAGSAVATGTINPYSPAAGHSYRHGVLPTISTSEKMKSYAATHPNMAATTGPETLSYGGGVDGIGVNSGHSKTYLVFYGNQWGTSSTDASGNLKFTGDPDGAASAAQQMFTGIGTNNELWSADLTQWCDGTGVATGATACPASGSQYIPYQTGGVLAGVWYDNSVASPSAASGHQLGQEAVNAAAHFGNTTAASNRYSYYVILSPHGTNPDNYQGAYCAWHDYNGDPNLTGGAVSSPYGDIAFSNQPYNMDSGASCGVGFVNSPGTLDGWTITLGHEWHEMMSDKNPAGGWTNNTGSSYNGEENSDECAWISPGTAGGAANVSFGSYGTYAEQASWSNDTNACAISHPIVSHGTVTVANPGNQTGTVGSAASLQMSASGGTAPYTWSAAGLPTGLSINSSTGLISGTPSAAGTYSVTVTATDTTNLTGSASFTWTIGTTGGGTVVVTNPGNRGGYVGNADSVPMSVSGGTAPYTWTATGLPPGISIDKSIGQMTGVYTTPGSYAVMVTATDSTGAAGSTGFTWTVTTGPLALSAPHNQTGTVGTYVRVIPAAANGGTWPYTWSATGLPPGISLAGSEGQMSGTPTTAGTYTVTETVKDAANATSSGSFTWTISTMSVVFPGNQNWEISVTLSLQMQAIGGTPPYTWTSTGLPGGVTITGYDGLIHGSPSSRDRTGNYLVGVTAKDSNGFTASTSFTYTLNPSVSITSIPTQTLTVGQPYQHQMAATGGWTPYTWSATNLPRGLTITSGGLISGTPTASSNTSTKITVTDGIGATDSFNVTWNTII